MEDEGFLSRKGQKLQEVVNKFFEEHMGEVSKNMDTEEFKFQFQEFLDTNLIFYTNVYYVKIIDNWLEITLFLEPCHQHAVGISINIFSTQWGINPFET